MTGRKKSGREPIANSTAASQMAGKTVGRGRPPTQSQFRKGQSGNPKGRPKGSKNLSTLYLAEVNAKIPITENGKRKRIGKLAAVIKQQVTRGAAGDPKSIEQVLNRVDALERRSNERTAETRPFTDRDREVLEIIYRVLQQNKETTT